MSFPVLFGGTVIGFAASAVLVLSVTLPWPKWKAQRKGKGLLNGKGSIEKANRYQEFFALIRRTERTTQ